MPWHSTSGVHAGSPHSLSRSPSDSTLRVRSGATAPGYVGSSMRAPTKRARKPDGNRPAVAPLHRVHEETPGGRWSDSRRSLARLRRGSHGTEVLELTLHDPRGTGGDRPIVHT